MVFVRKEPRENIDLIRESEKELQNEWAGTGTTWGYSQEKEVFKESFLRFLAVNNHKDMKKIILYF